MPDPRPSLRSRRAANALETHLRAATGQAPERLDARTVGAAYPRRSFVRGWRLNIGFSDGVTRRIDILLGEAFPNSAVRTALVDHPPPMTWPHVESDGVLCLLPNLADWDPDAPGDVAENLLGRSVQLVEELLEGTIVDRDFREEFLTYWAYRHHANAGQVVSLLRLEGHSRVVKSWRGHDLEVVAETDEALSSWVKHRFGDDCDVTTTDAAFVWLDPAPLPAQYPETSADVWALAVSAGGGATEALTQAVAGEPDQLLVVFGAEGRGGAGAVQVRVPNPKHLHAHPRSAREPLSKGFRPGRAPLPVLKARFFEASPVTRGGVLRADAAWVHGRGRDSRTETLLKSTLVLFGAGSVGAPLACTLALAGVGRIVIVDYDTLSWANVGRHPLGATNVGRNKALALAEKLQADFPHLEIVGRDASVHAVLYGEPNLLEQANLIVAATGSWSAEHALNRWHIARGRSRPVLYAWCEAHACAGHAVVIGEHGGCLQCHIGRTGAPEFRVADWPDGDANQEEPACGAHYQPYGPVELAHVNAMICDVALGALLDPPRSSTARTHAGTLDRITAEGGVLSDAWMSLGVPMNGQTVLDRSWPPAECSGCTNPGTD